MTPWPTHVYKLKLSHLPEIKQIALIEQIANVNSRGLPPILTLKHLSLLTHTNYRFLRAIVGRRVLCYKEIKIRKKNSKEKRTIHIPFFQLEKTQKWIDKYLLTNIPVHHRAFAYRTGYSIKDCAKQHCGAKWIVKIDIKSFFESISECQVYNIFRENGYGSLISFELARLCTHVDYSKDYSCRLTSNFKDRCSHLKLNESNVANNTEKKYSIEHYDSDTMGYVVQGAPTSPRLSNIIMKNIDEKFYMYCLKNNIVYIRYSDDLIFSSSDNKFSRDSALRLKRYVYSVLKNKKFMPNENKFSIISPRGRKLVLGLMVDNESPRLTPEFKKKINQHLYFLNKNVDRHMNRCKFKTRPGFKNHIDGLMNYIHDIDEIFYSKIATQYTKINWDI